MRWFQRLADRFRVNHGQAVVIRRSSAKARLDAAVRRGDTRAIHQAQRELEEATRAALTHDVSRFRHPSSWRGRHA